MGFSRIETCRFLARESRRAQLSEKAIEALELEMQYSTDLDQAIESHLATCLSKLNEKSRRLIKGYYHKGRSPEALSKRESRTVEAIYKTIQRARGELQTGIERQIRKAQA